MANKMPKCSICDACGPCQTIRSIMKPVFRRYQRIYCTYESLRCLDLQIRRFLCQQQTQPITLPLAHACGVTTTTRPITLPLAHARGVITYTLLCVTSNGIATFVDGDNCTNMSHEQELVGYSQRVLDPPALRYNTVLTWKSQSGGHYMCSTRSTTAIS